MDCGSSRGPAYSQSRDPHSEVNNLASSLHPHRPSPFICSKKQYARTERQFLARRIEQVSTEPLLTAAAALSI